MNFAKAKTVHVFKEKKGFSLIELLVAMVIMSVVSLAIYSLFAVNSRSYTTQTVTADVHQAVILASSWQRLQNCGLPLTASMRQ